MKEKIKAVKKQLREHRSDIQMFKDALKTAHGIGREIVAYDLGEYEKEIVRLTKKLKRLQRLAKA